MHNPSSAAAHPTGAGPVDPWSWVGESAARPLLLEASASRWVRRVARWSGGLFLLLVIGVLCLPWRQFVPGAGRVIAFDPLERATSVEAQVSGRIRRLLIVEGQRVAKGDPLAEIQDNDPNLLGNLAVQQTALKSRRQFASNRVDELRQQLAQQQLALGQARDAARQRVVASRSAAEMAALNFNRNASLAGKGLVSRRELELATQAREVSAADLGANEAILQRTESDFQAVLAGLRAQVASAQADIAVVDREVAALEIAISQNLRQSVEAPRDGIVLKVGVSEGTYLRPGTPICVIIPETEARFVEIWLDGNDAPLIKPRAQVGGTNFPGSSVRLQFEGWPALQLAGWPGLAVGTFGGEVLFLDPTDNGKGKFRAVVAPVADPYLRGGTNAPVTWPSNRWLRQGVRVNGWVLLEKVPLWKEIWRQLNGFPPVIPDGDADKFPKTSY